MQLFLTTVHSHSCTELHSSKHTHTGSGFFCNVSVWADIQVFM